MHECMVALALVIFLVTIYQFPGIDLKQCAEESGEQYDQLGNKAKLACFGVSAFQRMGWSQITFQALSVCLSIPRNEFSQNYIENMWPHKVGYLLVVFFGQYIVPQGFYQVWDKISYKASGVFYFIGHLFYSMTGLFLLDDYVNRLHKKSSHRSRNQKIQVLVNIILIAIQIYLIAIYFKAFHADDFNTAIRQTQEVNIAKAKGEKPSDLGHVEVCDKNAYNFVLALMKMSSVYLVNIYKK